jgi:cell wall-associated NlpC family hydrolase
MAHIYSSPEIENPPLQTLSFGTALEVILLNERWSEVILPDCSTAFIQNGDISPPHLIAKADISLFAKRFLGLPYTWGGRSSFGFDCSGFIQMLYKEIGVLLPRDSKDQFLACTIKDSPEVCDLIFWGKSENDIRHVGLYLGEGKFIHASARENKPWLRISHLDDEEWSGKAGNYYPFRAAAFSK